MVWRCTCPHLSSAEASRKGRGCVILFWVAWEVAWFYFDIFLLLIHLLLCLLPHFKIPKKSKKIQKIPKMPNKFKAQLTHLMEWEPGIGVIIRLRTGLLTLIFQQHRLWQQLPMNPSQSCAHHWISPSTDMLSETLYMNISLPSPHLRQCQNVPI